MTQRLGSGPAQTRSTVHNALPTSYNARSTTPATPPDETIVAARRRVPKLILVPIVASLYVAAACAGPTVDDSVEPDVDYAGVCVDPHAHPPQRVDDSRCDSSPVEYPGTDDDATHTGSNTVLWYYYSTHSGATAPPIGGPVTGGTFTTPRTVPMPAGKDGGARVGASTPVIIRKNALSGTGGSVSNNTVSRSGVIRGGLGVGSGAKGSAGS